MGELGRGGTLGTARAVEGRTTWQVDRFIMMAKDLPAARISI
jgi:hypothetical protein